MRHSSTANNVAFMAKSWERKEEKGGEEMEEYGGAT